MTAELSAREREILLFENQWFRFQGHKEGMIRDKWGISLVRYFQILNTTIKKPAAMAYDPILVKRLQAVVERRALLTTEVRP